MSSHRSTVVGALRNYNRVLASYESQLTEGISSNGHLSEEEAEALLEDCSSFRDSLGRDRRVAREREAISRFYGRLSIIESKASRYVSANRIHMENTQAEPIDLG